MGRAPAALALAALLATPGARGEDAALPPPAPGDAVGFEALDRLRPWLPAPVWDHRDVFFYPGMRLQIGETRDYTPAAAYVEATRRFAGRARIGPDGSLEGYVAGQPFPMDGLDCAGDPRAGVKILWNFDHQWEGDGRRARFRYTYWDRGTRLPIYYVGRSKLVWMTARVEPQHLAERGGDLLPDERRKTVYGIDVTEPFDSRGTSILTYRYKASERPLSASRNDDTWVYVPSMRRVRRISTAQRTDAVAGTDFTLDDLRGFNGIIPQYEWTCLGERRLLAPTASRVRAWPYEPDHDFGPSGLSLASDRWELRRAVGVRMVPRNEDHPYSRKELWLDRQTLVPLYAFAWDRNGELWKVFVHATRWSEDAPEEHPGWKGVERPRDLKVVADVILNVQTGTGNRIELWDADGTPFASPARLKRYIDLRRLSQGR